MPPTSTTASSSTCSFSANSGGGGGGGKRRSTRRRQKPLRYGFDPETTSCVTKSSSSTSRKRQKLSHNGVTLLDLPEEILRTILCSYLSSTSDRFALQATNRIFHNISNSPECLGAMKLLDSASAADGGARSPGDFCIVRPADTSSTSTQKLLPFAQGGNLDALLLLGLIAIYVEDDLETGLSLLQRGAGEEDNRAKYELGNLLLRRRNDADKAAGQKYIDEAAASETSHALSVLMVEGTRTSAQRALARQEMLAVAPLRNLIARKFPPRPSWGPFPCWNADCIRTDYKLSTRCKAWLKEKPFSDGWKHRRPQILACGIPSPHYDEETFFFVPRTQVCSRCQNAAYCSKACQILHWRTHKVTCRPPPVLAQLRQGVIIQ